MNMLGRLFSFRYIVRKNGACPNGTIVEKGEILRAGFSDHLNYQPPKNGDSLLRATRDGKTFFKVPDRLVNRRGEMKVGNLTVRPGERFSVDRFILTVFTIGTLLLFSFIPTYPFVFITVTAGLAGFSWLVRIYYGFKASMSCVTAARVARLTFHDETGTTATIDLLIDRVKEVTLADEEYRDHLLQDRGLVTDEAIPDLLLRARSFAAEEAIRALWKYEILVSDELREEIEPTVRDAVDDFVRKINIYRLYVGDDRIQPSYPYSGIRDPNDGSIPISLVMLGDYFEDQPHVRMTMNIRGVFVEVSGISLALCPMNGRIFTASHSLMKVISAVHDVLKRDFPFIRETIEEFYGAE
jgi:hypothetical protein